MLISLVPRNNLLECLKSDEELFDGIALLIESPIELEQPPAFWLLLGFPVDWDVAPRLPFLIVLENFPGIVG